MNADGNKKTVFPYIDYEEVDSIKRWTVVEKRNPWVADAALGVVLLVFPISLSLPLILGQNVTMFATTSYLLGIVSIGMGSAFLFYNAIKSFVGKNHIVIELTDDNIIGASTAVPKQVFKTVNVELRNIKQLIVSDDSAIILRGPGVNETLAWDLPSSLIQDLAQQLTIAINKSRNHEQLMALKLGEAPNRQELELYRSEPGTNVQPGDSEFVVSDSGKSKRYQFRMQKKIWHRRVTIGVGSLLAAIGLGLHFVWSIFHGQAVDPTVLIWVIPSVGLVIIAIWQFALARETTEVLTSHFQLTQRTRFLFKEEVQTFEAKDIASFSYVNIGTSMIESQESPEFGPFYSVFLYDSKWQRHYLFVDVCGERDVQWLVSALSKDMQILPPTFGK